MSAIAAFFSSLQLYCQRRVLTIFIMGFSSGLPLMLVFGVLSFWLREAGVSREQIGYFSWVIMVYAIKFIWSPLIDHLSLPVLKQWLGRRRSWLMLSQSLIILAVLLMATMNPQTELKWMALCAVLLAIASATQDITIDAYRIEAAPERLQAVLAAAYLAGYRLAMIFSSAGTLWIAALFSTDTGYDLQAWQSTYLVMAGCMALGLLTTLLSPEPVVEDQLKISPAHSSVSQKLMNWLNWATKMAVIYLPGGNNGVVRPGRCGAQSAVLGPEGREMKKSKKILK